MAKNDDSRMHAIMFFAVVGALGFGLWRWSVGAALWMWVVLLFAMSMEHTIETTFTERQK